jgi:hypothetical protein
VVNVVVELVGEVEVVVVVVVEEIEIMIVNRKKMKSIMQLMWMVLRFSHLVRKNVLLKKCHKLLNMQQKLGDNYVPIRSYKRRY